MKEARRGGYILEFKVRLTPTRLGGRTRREAENQIPRCVSEKAGQLKVGSCELL